jgi:hypothetical protein
MSASSFKSDSNKKRTKKTVSARVVMARKTTRENPPKDPSVLIRVERPKPKDGDNN